MFEPDLSLLDGSLAATLGLDPAWTGALRRHSRYQAVLRFQLVDAKSRTFMAERFCFLGGIEDWLPLRSGQLPALLREFLPHLGKESFFELF